MVSSRFYSPVGEILQLNVEIVFTIHFLLLSSQLGPCSFPLLEGKSLERGHSEYVDLRRVHLGDGAATTAVGTTLTGSPLSKCLIYCVLFLFCILWKI